MKGRAMEELFTILPVNAKRNQSLQMPYFKVFILRKSEQKNKALYK